MDIFEDMTLPQFEIRGYKVVEKIETLTTGQFYIYKCLFKVFKVILNIYFDIYRTHAIIIRNALKETQNLYTHFPCLNIANFQNNLNKLNRNNNIHFISKHFIFL